jgi:hypothetical protein
LEGCEDDPGHLMGTGGAEARGFWRTEPKDWKGVGGGVECSTLEISMPGVFTGELGHYHPEAEERFNNGGTNATSIKS